MYQFTVGQPVIVDDKAYTVAEYKRGESQVWLRQANNDGLTRAFRASEVKASERLRGLKAGVNDANISEADSLIEMHMKVACLRQYHLGPDYYADGYVAGFEAMAARKGVL